VRYFGSLPLQGAFPAPSDIRLAARRLTKPGGDRNQQADRLGKADSCSNEESLERLTRPPCIDVVRATPRPGARDVIGSAISVDGRPDDD